MNTVATFYHAFFLPAFANGLFLAIITKTGMDISPAGLGLRIFSALDPYVTEQNVMIFRFAEIGLFILPWLSYVVIFLKFGLRGLIVFTAIVVGSYILILYLWK